MAAEKEGVPLQSVATTFRVNTKNEFEEVPGYHPNTGNLHDKVIIK